MSSAVQSDKKQKAAMPAGPLEQMMPSVKQIKFTLNPMHLLVQKADFAYKVTYHSKAQLPAASPHKHRFNFFPAIVETQL